MSSIAVAAPARNLSGVPLILAGILWGTGGLSGSVLATGGHLHPLSVATYRLLLGGLFAVLFLWLTGGLRAFPRTRAAAGRLLVAGGLLGFFQASYFLAVSLSSVSIATMTTIGGAPVFVAVVTAVRARRVPGAATLVSIGAALVGLVMLRWSPERTGGDLRLVGGIVFSLLAGAGFATLTLIMARQVDGLDPLRTTAFGCLIGGMLLLPVVLARHGDPVSHRPAGRDALSRFGTNGVGLCCLLPWTGQGPSRAGRAVRFAGAADGRGAFRAAPA
jgi:DME family drug/metabolite transporter